MTTNEFAHRIMEEPEIVRLKPKFKLRSSVIIGDRVLRVFRMSDERYRVSMMVKYKFHLKWVGQVEFTAPEWFDANKFNNWFVKNSALANTVALTGINKNQSHSNIFYAKRREIFMAGLTPEARAVFERQRVKKIGYQPQHANFPVKIGIIHTTVKAGQELINRIVALGDEVIYQ